MLIVDDDPGVRDFLRRCLSMEGYVCQVAADADEAWARLDPACHRLIISDVNMPGDSGIDLLQRVRTHHRDAIAMIMVTGLHDKEIGIRAVELGAYSYLAKPFSANEVAVHVANALERRRLVLESQRFQERLAEEVLEAQRDIGWRLLTAVRWRDEETGAHITRVGRGTQAVGRRLGWAAERVEWAELAAALHDIGKIAVPDAILRKEGPLSPTEFALVQRHTIVGDRMLSGSHNPLLRMAREIARSHHERWDGHGYPDGLTGRDIPEPARVVSILDVYDALTSDRPYRRALPEDEALDLMSRDRERHFDPEIFDVFVASLPELRRIAATFREDDGDGPPSIDLLPALTAARAAAGL